MNIIVINKGNQWKAWIEDDPQMHAFGESKAEAIGKLILNNQRAFIVTIKES